MRNHPCKALLILTAGLSILSSPLLAAEKKAILRRSPTVEDAKEFIEEAEARLLEVENEFNRAAWVKSTYITEDTEILAAKANERYIEARVHYAKQAARFERLALPPEVMRKIKLLKLSLTLPAPSEAGERAELTRLATAMEGAYGRGKYCPPGSDQCLDIVEITRLMAASRDPRELLDVWRGWHAVGAPIRKDYVRYVELVNKGARELGFADFGAMWRSNYDMPPEDFAREADRLWEQVKPLYLSLHAYVRRRLRERYGAGVVPASGPLPAHLLGNLWAQSWDNTYSIVAPKDAEAGFDLTQVLKDRNTEHKQMVRLGESFFTSLGFAPLPETFWTRSLFVKPRDREVVCHASAWDVDNADDLRIKMCIDITDEDFRTVHHELGHNFYQRAYNRQPYLFRNSAHDGFHEALGDTIALSITPEYLVKLGLMEKVPPASQDISFLLHKALEKIAFLPFGLLIDQWRWKVFSGEVPPSRYNEAWWQLRLKYQGVAPAEARGEEYFDPGAKYHVPANVAYTRYFLAEILQFQFHRALARAAGCQEPIHRCSIYGSKEAGKRLNAMMEMGQSRPWPDALEALTGERRMDAAALREYFAPLEKWLEEQNRGKPVGW
jgi:peptidyl-dipeptidase A